MGLIQRNSGIPRFSTLAEAVASDLREGQLVLTLGEISELDGKGLIYSVESNGSGGIAIVNGNELVQYTGTAATNNEEDFVSGKVSSVDEIAGLVGLSDNQQISLLGWHPDSDAGGGVLYWDSTKLKSEHNGGTVFSPTVPWTVTTGDYLNAVGEADPSGAGCWVREDNMDYRFSFFGSVGDGVADDTAALQATLTASFLNQRNVTGANVTCRTTDTVYVGNYSNATTYTAIDFGGLIIKPDDSVVVTVDSGKLIGGVWETAWNDPIETFMSFFTFFGNFRVLGSSDAAKTGRTAVRLKDWHYQCEIKHIGMTNFETGMSIKHVFGIELDQCSCFNTNPNNKTGQGFLLNDNVNLVKMHRCLSTNTEIGYHLQGGVSAVSFDNCSFEGETFGLVCKDAVYALEVSNCYMENITDTCFVFQSQVYSANISNNYINLSTIASVNAYILDYLELPNNNIVFDSDNTILWTGLTPLPDDQFIKDMNLHTTFGYNRLSLERKVAGIASLDDLLLDNSDFPGSLDIKQTVETSGYKADVVNVYAKGIYSGRYSNGRDNAGGNGFEWIDDTSAVMNLRTRIVPSTASRIYVSLRISGGTLGLIRGELVGDCNVTGIMDFYEYTPTGMDKTNLVTVSTVDGFFHLHYTHSATITAVVGEVRLS